MKATKAHGNAPDTGGAAPAIGVREAQPNVPAETNSQPRIQLVSPELPSAFRRLDISRPFFPRRSPGIPCSGSVHDLKPRPVFLIR